MARVFPATAVESLRIHEVTLRRRRSDSHSTSFVIRHSMVGAMLTRINVATTQFLDRATRFVPLSAFVPSSGTSSK